ncbi:MAG: T9SS type A sorting domain-containing protein [Ferruginibacter sp.]
MKFYFWLMLCSLAGITASGQRTCETEAYVAKYFTPDLAARELPPNAPARDTSPNEIITIPVVVHILFNNQSQLLSDARVYAQIDALNEDYRMLNADNANVPEAFKSRSADAKIMFCLAQVDPEGRPTTGIVKKYTTKSSFYELDAMKSDAKGGSNAWDSKNYLNIWVCAMFSRTLGYATPPGGDATKDGVVINYDVFGDGSGLRSNFDKGRTATHEVAHWLGLKHIWGDADCGDDGIADTPPQSSYNYGCPVFPRPSYCSINADGDMFMNFMDLTNDACMYMFTTGQKNKMRAQFALGGLRNSFLRSYRCDGSFASGAPLPQDTLPVAKSADPIKIYPNPVIDELVIESKEIETLSGRSLQVFNTEGRLLLTTQLQSNKQKIVLSQLLPGVYILKIDTNTGIRSFKIVKL